MPDGPITIRRCEPDDYKVVQQIYVHPRVIRGTLQLPFPSAEEWRKRLASSEDVYSLLACAGDEVIGQLGLHTKPHSPRRRHVAELGMAVRDDWQGRGVGTALLQAAVELADRWLNLRRIELEVFTDNEPAVRLYKKFGFEIEGTLIDFAFRDGEYAAVYFMARLRR